MIGAGTMGSGIALAALYAGCRVRLYDVSTEILQEAVEYIHQYLDRKNQADKRANLTTHNSLEGMTPADIWIEAVPEKLELKQRVFQQIEEVASSSAIIATNTSTLPVTSIAAVLEQPGRALGLHFFNPAAVMPLVEVITADKTEAETLEQALSFVAALDKTGINATDSPGFIVNRVARPFYGEALMLLSEGGATIEQIDQLVEGLGFPMGPFRLMDFIGNDVNLAATRSVFEQTFYEPRFRPSVIQQRLVQSGKLGRKSGQGFYAYPLPEEEAKARARATGEGAAFRIFLAADDFAPGLRNMLAEAAVEMVEVPAEAEVIIMAAASEAEMLVELEKLQGKTSEGALVLCQSVTLSLAHLRRSWPQPENVFGFDSLMAAQAELIEVVSHDESTHAAKARIEDFVSQIGRRPIWVSDGPGLVLPRILAMLVNEAAFAVQEGVAAPEKIDQAMLMGVRYPQGPLAWGESLGFDRVLKVLQDLAERHGDPRYRSAAVLRRWAEEVQ